MASSSSSAAVVADATSALIAFESAVYRTAPRGRMPGYLVVATGVGAAVGLGCLGLIALVERGASDEVALLVFLGIVFLVLVPAACLYAWVTVRRECAAFVLSAEWPWPGVTAVTSAALAVEIEKNAAFARRCYETALVLRLCALTVDGIGADMHAHPEQQDALFFQLSDDELGGSASLASAAAAAQTQAVRDTIARCIDAYQTRLGARGRVSRLEWCMWGNVQ